jgi:hypothetical protein
MNSRSANERFLAFNVSFSHGDPKDLQYSQFHERACHFLEGLAPSQAYLRWLDGPNAKEVQRYRPGKDGDDLSEFRIVHKHQLELLSCFEGYDRIPMDKTVPKTVTNFPLVTLIDPLCVNIPDNIVDCNSTSSTFNIVPFSQGVQIALRFRQRRHGHRSGSSAPQSFLRH